MAATSLGDQSLEGHCLYYCKGRPSDGLKTADALVWICILTETFSSCAEKI